MSETIEYKGEITLALSVKNLDAAIARYGEHLGFELLYRLDDMAWCEMKTPIPAVSVGLGENEKVPKEGCTPVWGVKSIDAARASLEGRGVRFDGETREVPGMVRLATFFDPDGNSWMLAESLEKGS